jgi:large subunit ribosomal protein L35
MPKMKTNKSIAKRVKVTARGKLLRHRAGAGHLKSRKSPRRIRRFRKVTSVSRGFARHVRKMLGI